MIAATFKQEREELNDEILQIKRTLQSMEDEFSEEDEDNEDALLDRDSCLVVEPVDNEQGTAADPITHDDQLLFIAGSSTTSSENSLKTVLSLNRAYQTVVRESLQRVELALDQNRERQMAMKEELEQVVKEQNSRNQKNPVIAFAVPYFRDVNGMNPPLNDDALLKRQSNEGNPFVKPPKQWVPRDKKKLKDAVRSDALRRQMRPLMNRKEILMVKRFETSSLANVEDIEREMKQLDEDIENIKGWSDSKLFGSRLDTSCIDWLKISSVDFDGERSAVACELMWRNAAHPSINTCKWGSDEDTQLDNIVRQQGERDWTAIADELGTNRTPFQCLQRYQTRLNPCLATGKWSPEEDKFLLEVVASYQEVDEFIPWSQVADYLEGRSQEQCATRWAKLKELEQTKSRTWTTEEDMKLIETVQWFGPKSWMNVAKFVPGRTDVQCRERWTNALDTRLKIGNWTYEEDRIIWLSVQRHGGGKWVKLAEQLPGRTDNMVLHRYSRMKRCRDAEDQLSQIPMTKRAKEAAERNQPKISLEEARMIDGDKAKGIDVPRPIKGVTGRYVRKLELRRRLHDMIKLRVQRGLTDGSSCTQAQLDTMLESNNNPGVKTVRSMLVTSRILQNAVGGKGSKCKAATASRKGRQKSSMEARRLRLEIIELLQAVKGKRPAGRPRIRPAEDVNKGALNNIAECDTAGTNNMDNSPETHTHVAGKIFQALQVDVTGMTRRARQVKVKQNRAGDAKSRSTSRRRHKEDQQNKDLDLWDAVAMETTQPEASGDEDWCFVVNKPKSCTLAAIPPNTTTLSAFKSLLLHKGSLSVTAGRKPQPKPRARTSTKVGSTTRVTTQQSGVWSSQGGSTPVVAIPSSSSDNITMIEFHDNKMKAKHLVAIRNVVAVAIDNVAVDPPDNATAANVQEFVVAGPPDGANAARIQEPMVVMKSEYDKTTEGQLEKIRAKPDYQLLRERMYALFLWPALLSAIPLDNRPTESNHKKRAAGKRKTRFPYSRGKKYRKYTMKPINVKKVHQELCRKNIETRILSKQQGTSPDMSVEVGNSAGGEGMVKLPLDVERGAENPTKETEQNNPPVEGRKNRRGRPKGGGKKRIWKSYGVRQTRGRSQKEANTQVVPDVVSELHKQVSPPEGAVISETISSPPNVSAVDGMDKMQTQVVPRNLVTVTDSHRTLPPEGTVILEMISSSPDVSAVDRVNKAQTQAVPTILGAITNVHKTLPPEDTVSSETINSPPNVSAVVGMNTMQTQDVPRNLGVVTDVSKTLPPEGAVSSETIYLPPDVSIVDGTNKMQTQAVPRILGVLTMLPKEEAAETVSSPPDVSAIDGQQRHLEGNDVTTGATGSDQQIFSVVIKLTNQP